MLGVNFSISEEVEHLELKSQAEELLVAEVEDLGGKLRMHCFNFIQIWVSSVLTC